MRGSAKSCEVSKVYVSKSDFGRAVSAVGPRKVHLCHAVIVVEGNDICFLW